MMLYESVVLATALVAVINAAPSFSSPPTVTLDSGVVIGTTTSLSDSRARVNKFLGIPFAAQPVRFAPAVTPEPWSTPFDATAYGPACYQQFNYPEASRNLSLSWYNTPPPPAGESEDCLNLNVYVPARPCKDRTVMVWIYGGGLTFGANSFASYDGTGFAANQDVIIVVINYRTNVFGFPASPELELTERNLGYLDQRLALDWVQRNIAAFGGDPKKVTIFGESAGAASVDSLVTTLPDNPPFRAAITQSGQTTLYTNTENNVPRSWNALAAALNCTTTHPESNLTCIRSYPADVVKFTVESLALPFRPVSDNVTNLRYPSAARLRGEVAKVPILTGNNADEGTVFSLGVTNATAFLLNSQLPNQTQLVQSIVSAYPVDPNNANAQIDDILTEYIFQCPAGIVANDTAAAGIPAWRYFFNASFANTQRFPGAGVYHASEIPIVFGTSPRPNITEGQIALSEAMQTAWANFAKNPTNGPGFESVPEVAVWGNGVGLTGDGSGELLGSTSAGALDRRCALFRPVYEARGLADPAGRPS